MKYDTERLIGTIGGGLCIIIGLSVFTLNFDLFLRYHRVPSIVAVNIGAILLAGIGMALLLRYLFEILVFPWELRVHWPGGGD